MCEDLLNLGIVPQKTKQLKIPVIPSQLVFHFIRGYFDGDGNVWSGTINNKRITPTRVLQITFTSGCRPFLFALRSLLNKNGIKGGAVYLPKNKQFGRLTFSTVSALLLANAMYADQSKLYLSRKKKKLDDFVSTYKPRKNIAIPEPLV
ncbi:MAG: LAGLIDADG family homing endonuclease [Candidatus Pacebacteria bacterium]|nr:LAGLIDADG family homing endonuclease [Candidatus Paceibacterota bacterium]